MNTHAYERLSQRMYVYMYAETFEHLNLQTFEHLLVQTHKRLFVCLFERTSMRGKQKRLWDSLLVHRRFLSLRKFSNFSEGL